MTKQRLMYKSLTLEEKKMHINPFDSAAWIRRKRAIKARVLKQQGEAHKRALKRKKEAKK